MIWISCVDAVFAWILIYIHFLIDEAYPCPVLAKPAELLPSASVDPLVAPKSRQVCSDQRLTRSPRSGGFGLSHPR